MAVLGDFRNRRLAEAGDFRTKMAVFGDFRTGVWPKLAILEKKMAVFGDFRNRRLAEVGDFR